MLLGSHTIGDNDAIKVGIVIFNRFKRFRTIEVYHRPVKDAINVKTQKRGDAQILKRYM